jgi:hypothetical protein
MKPPTLSRRSVIAALVVVIGIATWVGVNRSRSRLVIPEATSDWNRLQGLEQYRVEPVAAAIDPQTGFHVGGKNDTALLRQLKSINGRSISDLEADMQPGATSNVGSNAGFLGRDEQLLNVLAADNAYVVDELGLTHQELAHHLHAMGAVARWQRSYNLRDVPFTYRGLRLTVSIIEFKGPQPSPFEDGTLAYSDITVTNLRTGQKLWYGLLLPAMIERYGFYEGKGTKYRVEPKEVIEMFGLGSK